MTLPVSFRRAARAEFIEAAAWYEARQFNLCVEFIAEIDRCVDLAAEQPLLSPLFITAFVVLSLNGSPTTSITALSLTVLWFLLSFMPAAIRLSGSAEPNSALQPTASSSASPQLL